MQVQKKEDESSSEDEGRVSTTVTPRSTSSSSLPTLAALQRAWNTDITNITRPCSHCFTPNAQYKCSRCELVRYCNVSCQSSYHPNPIHKLECIDARQHQKYYWGMFDSSKTSGEKEGVVDDFAVLRARRSSKRRESTDLNIDLASIYFPLSICLIIIFFRLDCHSRPSPAKGCCCRCCRKSKTSTYGAWSSQQGRG